MNVGIDWRKLDKPVTWEEIFENTNPVNCEIGYGSGGFISTKARGNPEKNFFGIDYSSTSFRKASKKVRNMRLSNVKLVCMEAKSSFLILIPELSLSNIFINFPDPWPKKKHHKNRLLDREFIRIAASRMVEGGKLLIATDDKFYRDFILEEIEYTELWNSLFTRGWTEELSERIVTKYEKKWLSRGKDIYYMVFQKKRNPENKFHIKTYDIENIEFTYNPVRTINELKEKVIKENHSIAKILSSETLENRIRIKVLFKDDTFRRKREFKIVKNSDNKWKLTFPEDIYPSTSVKIFMEKLKTLNK